MNKAMHDIVCAEVKSLFRSRTFWVAVGQAVVGIITAAMAASPGLQATGGGLVIKSLIDVALRLSTKEPVQVPVGK